VVTQLLVAYRRYANPPHWCNGNLPCDRVDS
jgi:hypothetical protein